MGSAIGSVGNYLLLKGKFVKKKISKENLKWPSTINIIRSNLGYNFDGSGSFKNETSQFFLLESIVWLSSL